MMKPIALAALLTVALVPASAAETGVTDTEIKIGACNDQGSPSGIRGKLLTAGARAYYEYVNEKGGVHGRKINLIARDDLYDPEKTIECLKGLIADGVFAGAHFLGSPNAAKVMPMAESNKLPVFGFISGAGFIYEPVKRYMFNLRASYEDETKEFVDVAWRKLGHRKIAVIYQDDAFGVSNLDGVNRALKAYGATPVAVASLPRASLDVAKAVETVMAAKPDAVILGLIGPPVREIVKTAKAAGSTSLFMTTTIDPAVYEAEGTVIAQLMPPFDDEKLTGVALYNKLLKKYPEAKPGYVGLEGFAQAMVVVEGLKRAGRDLTREKFVGSLELIKDYDMGMGDLKVTFGSKDRKGTEKTYFTVVKGGKAVPLTDWSPFVLKKS
jgi:branched-chain amino acid transport system substrate-binding protein